jgi:serine/threonine-protein kinase RsbT
MAAMVDLHVERKVELALRSGEDVVRLRQAVRENAVAVGFSLVDQTKIVTAASELGRNTVQYGGGGRAEITVVSDGGRRGVRLEFIDQGPGIADLKLAMQDGYTTGGGLGLGLSGAKRLSDAFEIDSSPGQGTRVAIVRWKAR